MQRPTQKIKVFIDTNVLIAGVNSVTGASATFLDLCEAGVLQMVVSRQVLIEADRNFTAKFPQWVGRFRQFMHNLAPLMVEDPTPESIKKAAAIVDRKDAPILAAAQNANVDFLITLDKKHFLNPKTREKMMLKVVSPIEFLQSFKKLFLEE
ncbi:MAG: putative toxin-antitoxin system toxin component, PIN family [Desulfobacterales bacterium]|nr:putative toxin-antitoxin system toxin component, PIN family [Desulfobacterales bacterium]